MLNEDERREIAAQLGHYEEDRAACVEALKIVQRRRGWVPDEELLEVAGMLGMSVAELEGVSTFYNLVFRRAVGRHVILLCDSVSCWIMGYERLCARLERRLGVRLGETTADRRFTLLPCVCLGACDHAPVLMIDETLHEDVDPDQLDPILARYE
jgi:NADH-quinone oxidoreductase subunit E